MARQQVRELFAGHGILEQSGSRFYYKSLYRRPLGAGTWCSFGSVQILSI